MTVRELVERLQKQPQDAEVFVCANFDVGNRYPVDETDIESVNGPGTPWRSFIFVNQDD